LLLPSLIIIQVFVSTPLFLHPKFHNSSVEELVATIFQEEEEVGIRRVADEEEGDLTEVEEDLVADSWNLDVH
jgi:hypothetical protein